MPFGLRAPRRLGRKIGGIIGGRTAAESYNRTKHAKKKPAVAGLVVVEVSGLEPLTPYMRSKLDVPIPRERPGTHAAVGATSRHQSLPIGDV